MNWWYLLDCCWYVSGDSESEMNDLNDIYMFME